MKLDDIIIIDNIVPQILQDELESFLSEMYASGDIDVKIDRPAGVINFSSVRQRTWVTTCARPELSAERARLRSDATSTRAHRVHVRLESGLDYDYERERDRVL